MNDHHHVENLDLAVDILVAKGDAQRAVHIDDYLRQLLWVAGDLRYVASPKFRARLRKELQTRSSHSLAVSRGVRPGFHTITPYIVVNDPDALIDFARVAFGAKETFRAIGSGGGYHCEVRIDDSMLMVGGGLKYQGPARPTSFHIMVEDIDVIHRRAIAAGAVSLYEPTDQPYGDRDSAVQDVTGNNWYLFRRREVPKGMRSVTLFFHPVGSARFVDFVKRGLGAQEISVYREDDVIKHAALRIGDSVIELGEAHSQWQPMPTGIYLYVDDADTWYDRALGAGATSVQKPIDTQYGDRMAGVRDEWGNEWYPATAQ